jgi:hypothetical protein
VEEFDPFLPTFRYEWYEYCSHYTLHGKLRERISCGRGSSLLPFPFANAKIINIVVRLNFPANFQPEF